MNSASCTRQCAFEVADDIDQSKLVYVGATTALLTLNDRDLPRRLRETGFDEGSTVRLLRTDGSYYEGLDFWKSLATVRDNPTFNIDFMRTFQSMVLSRVGQKLKDHGLYDHSPEHEFMRHLRNAISHGNRWYFQGAEPRRPTSFAGIMIDRTFHGQVALYDTVQPGDVFALLDRIAGSMRAL